MARAPIKELPSLTADAAAVDEALGRLLVERGRLDAAGLGRARRVREASHDRCTCFCPSSAWLPSGLMHANGRDLLPVRRHLRLERRHRG